MDKCLLEVFQQFREDLGINYFSQHRYELHFNSLSGPLQWNYPTLASFILLYYDPVLGEIFLVFNLVGICRNLKYLLNLLIADYDADVASFLLKHLLIPDEVGQS